MRFVPL